MTTGLEEQLETAMGNLAIIDAVREVKGKDFAFVLHTILCPETVSKKQCLSANNNTESLVKPIRLVIHLFEGALCVF